MWHGKVGTQGPVPPPMWYEQAVLLQFPSPGHEGQWQSGPQEPAALFLKALGNRICLDQRKQQWLSLRMEFHSTRPPATQSLIHVTNLPISPWFVLSIKGASGSLSPIRENKWVISKGSLGDRTLPAVGGLWGRKAVTKSLWDHGHGVDCWPIWSMSAVFTGKGGDGTGIKMELQQKKYRSG